MGKIYSPSPFFKAIFSNNLENVRMHIRNGIDINKKENGHTPLEAASGGINIFGSIIQFKLSPDESRLQIVKELLENGAKLINSTDNDEEIHALHRASFAGHKDIVEFLLNKGATVNSHDNFGYTALHYSAYKSHHEIIELLINHGAQINIKSLDVQYNGQDETPLEYMAKSRYFTSNTRKSIELFIKNGLNIKDEGRGALHKALESGNEKMVFYLLSLGVRVGSLLTVASIEPDTEDLVGMGELELGPTSNSQVLKTRYLITHGADVNQKDANGISAIQLAANNRNILLVRELLKFGSEVPPIDNSWTTQIKNMISSVNNRVIMNWLKEDYKIEVFENSWYSIDLQSCHDDSQGMKKTMDRLKRELSEMFNNMTMKNNETTERFHMIKNDLDGKILVLLSSIEQGTMEKNRLLHEIDVLSNDIITLRRFTIGNENSE